MTEKPELPAGARWISDIEAEKPPEQGALAAPAKAQPVRAVGTVEVTDARGRKIAINKMNALHRLDLFEMLGPELSENQLYVGYAMSAACVASIDGQRFERPSKKNDIRILIQMLDDDGLEAVSRGYKEHFTKGETGDLQTIKN